MQDKIKGNETTVALVLINACAAFAILSACGPGNTKPYLLLVATLMGMGSFYPIFRLLQRPIRYKIRKETDGTQELYVLRYKGYLWWYDGTDKDGKRLEFPNMEKAIEFVRSNVITMLINQKMWQKQRKIKKEYETVLDSSYIFNENNENENETITDDNNPASEDTTISEAQEENIDEEEKQKHVIDNNASVEMLKKNIQLTKEKSNETDSDEKEQEEEIDDDDDDEEEKDEKDEKDEKEMNGGENTSNGTDNGHDVPADTKHDLHPAEELTQVFDQFDLDEKPKNKKPKNNNEGERDNQPPQPQQENTNVSQTNAQGASEQDDGENKNDESNALRLSNENPIQRFGPESVTDMISKLFSHDKKKAEKEKARQQDRDNGDAESNAIPKSKRNKKTYDDGLLEARKKSMTSPKPATEQAEDGQPPNADKTSSGGHKVVKKLEVNKPLEEKRDAPNVVFFEPPTTKSPQEDFQQGSEKTNKEPNDNTTNNPPNNDETDFWDDEAMGDDLDDDNADGDVAQNNEDLWMEGYKPSI